MHNSLNRIQSTFGFFTTCAFTLASLIAVLSLIPIPAPTSSPSASIAVRNVQVVKGRPHYYSTKREEYAQIRFDLEADLSSLFTWNTKQLFVYVTANYPSGGAMSEAVIWDTIIPATSTPYAWQNLKQKYWPEKKNARSKSRAKANGKANGKSKTTATDLVRPGVIALKNQKAKYQITDPSGAISSTNNATLHVSWNVQPWVGSLVWDHGVLGNRLAAWDARQVGRSAAFDFPALKGAKTDTVKDGQGPQTPDAASAVPVVDT